jgi:thioredoxin reductase (NADPH)
VFIAAGAGAFVPKALAIPGVPTDASAAALAGAQGSDALPPNLHHHLPPEGTASPWAGQHLVIAGGGEDALQTVLDILAAPAPQRPARLTLLHRRDQFQAEAALDAQVRALIAQGIVTLALGVPNGGAQDTSDHRLLSLTLLGADGEQLLPLGHLLVRQGLSPKLGPVANWGLHLDRKQVVVDTATFATSVEGLYAVGDINTYPGKKRLILCGFHEATMAAHAASSRLQPDAPQHLQYTTTSSLLQQRLGVK